MADKKVLVVDYEAGSLDKISKLLKSNKFHVIKAADGQSGYDKFIAEKPDLVVLEAMLPKMHGFDLTKRIVQESGGKVPVIVVSGLYKGPRYRQEAVGNQGAAEFFEKPLDGEALIAAVKKILHDDDEFEEDLPDANAVIEALSRRGKGHAPAAADRKPAAKGKRP